MQAFAFGEVEKTMDIQQIIALGIVAVAARSVGMRLWREWRSKDGECGGCGQCGRPARAGVREAPQAKPLVTLGSGNRPARFTPPTKG